MSLPGHQGNIDVDIWTAPGGDPVTKNCKGQSALAWWCEGAAPAYLRPKFYEKVCNHRRQKLVMLDVINKLWQYYILQPPQPFN